jgi:peptidoglycan/LPS O-acetylase OafA/YrhL
MIGWKRKLLGVVLIALAFCCVLLPKDYHGSPPDWMFILLLLFFILFAFGFSLLVDDGKCNGHADGGNWPI